jgi:enoyl-CoA hydratase
MDKGVYGLAMTKKFKNLLIEKEDGIGILTINRPHVLNALNSQTVLEIGQAVTELEEDKEVKVIIITGSGEKAFIAGGDISEMSVMDSMEGRKYGQLGQETLFKIENCSKPVIAAVNGYALGGGTELAMACDIRIASPNAKFGQPEVGLGITPGFAGTQRLPRIVGRGTPNAKFGQPEVGLGITPGFAGTQRLPRIVGRGKGKELIFSGEMIDSAQAEKIGLVNEVVPLKELMEEAKKLAKKIADKNQNAIKKAKELINHALDVDLVSGCTLESNAFGLCFSTMEQKDAMKAFLKKGKKEKR